MNQRIILGTGFFFLNPQKKKKRKQANLLQKPHKTRDRRHKDIHSHPTKNSHSTHTHNIPHKPHTTLHPNQKCAYGDMIKVGQKTKTNNNNK